MTRQRILSPQILEGFNKYTYNSVDTSVLSVHVMHPFWNWCVQFCPLWVAPNLLTFVGFLLTAANFALFTHYDNNFKATAQASEGHVPSWVWLLSSINLFVAYTLDGIDGKQARRTGTLGPLGELFDHGLDSYSTVLISTCLYSIFSMDELSPLRMHFVIWNIFINFYLTHWEKYNTGVMFLPWGYDFTMLGSVGVLLLTWWGTPKMWRVALPGGLTPGLVFEFVLYSSAMLTSQTVILWNIYKSYRDRTGKMHPFPEAMRPLIPLATFFALSTAWAVLSPSDIISRHPRLFYLLTGTIFSNISCKLIVAQMSGTRCAASNSLLPPYLFCVVMSLAFSWLPYDACVKIDTLLLYTMCPLSTLAHISYGVDVVSDLCDHFKIRCFRITPKVKSSNK